MLLFVLSTILYFGWIALSTYDNDFNTESDSDGYVKYEEIVVVSYLLYYCGKITLYILFIFRLYYSFQSSVYAVPNGILICIVIFVAVIVLSVIIYIIDLLIDIDEEIFGMEVELFESAWFLFFVVDVILSAIILYLFVSRLQMIGMLCFNMLC